MKKWFQNITNTFRIVFKLRLEIREQNKIIKDRYKTLLDCQRRYFTVARKYNALIKTCGNCSYCKERRNSA